MNREEALKLLTGGKDGVKEWNRRRDDREAVPILSNANLSKINLVGANFAGTTLRKANFTKANLSQADLSHAILLDATLTKANLSDANLFGSDLSDVDLFDSNLSHADLSGADLSYADLSDADLSEAKFVDADLWGAILRDANLNETQFAEAGMGRTIFGSNNLSKVHGLEHVAVVGPCVIDNATLALSEGRIPDSFLAGCGFKPWEIVNAKIYDPNLTALQIADLQAEAFRLRTEGPIFIGGVFISYAREDSDFVDKLRDKLRENGVSVWVDRHDAVAGSVDRQVVDAIRLHDIVLLVLSKSSVDSEWVEYELEKALKKEKDEKRDVLCPVTLDDAWKAKLDDVLWRQVKKKNVLDFSAWTDDAAFDPVFQKLLDGLKKYYPPKD